MSVLSQLNDLREASKFIDVLLVSEKDKEKVPAHRQLLASRSAYFSAMFTNPLPEHKKYEILIKDVTGKDLKSIISYCYSGIIELADDNADTILATASVFKLTDLINVCCDFLRNKINTAKCLGIWTVAEKHYCPRLLEHAKAYAYDNFMDISKCDEFLTLDNRRLREILASDELCVTSEDEVFLSLIRWFQHEQHEREQYISDLLSLVRIAFLSQPIVVEQKNCIVDSNGFQTFHREILQWRLSPTEKRPAINTRQRKWLSETLLAVMTLNFDCNIQIAKYCQKGDNWTTWTTLKQKQTRNYFGVAIMDYELVIAGGRLDNDDSEIVNTVISINTKTKKIKSLNPMRTCRQFLCLVALDENIYAIGGQDGDCNWLKSVERWNSRTCNWSNIASMIEEKEGPNAAILNGRIYVIGESAISLECYDPHTNSWTARAAMHEKRFWPGVTVLNGYLYAIGGLKTKTVERYDDNTNTWTMMCSLCTPRWGLGCIAMKDRIIAAGGWCTTVEEYNPIVNGWTQKAELNDIGPCVIVKARDISCIKKTSN